MNVRSLARLFILIFSIVLVATGCGTYFNLKIESTDPSSSQNQNGDGSSSENSDETGNPNNPNNPNNNGQSGSTALPELSFSISSKTISESDLLESANIQLSKASTTDINISYSVTGSAVYSSDHNLTDGSITISAGSTFIQLPLQILDDAIPDGAKQIVLTLNSSSAVQLVNPSTITITVTDDDIYPTYALDVSFGTLGSGLFKTSLDYTQGFGAAMDSQDRILVAGARSLSGSNNDLLIWRVTSQGTADLTFNGIGYHQWNNWNYDF